MKSPLAGVVLSSLLATSASQATDCFNSEFSHFAAGTAISSVTTVVVDKFIPKAKHPALIGFIVGTSEAILDEAGAAATGSHFSALDAASGTLGAIVGAYFTDKWYIAPRIESRKEETTYGVVATRKF